MNKLILKAGVALTALAVAAPALAQDNTVQLDEVVVTTPNRTATEASKVGSKVEVVTQEEIEAKSLPFVVDYLNTLPGVAIASTGGPGSEASLAIRGLPRRYVKTLFNGIDLADPTGTQAQTAYQYLLTGGLDSIEVLKGSQSTLYGSEAIAGVIAMNTLGGVTQGVHHELDLEGGSFGTAGGRYGLKAANERAKLAINVTGLTTDGISAAPGGPEKDGFENVQVDGAFEAKVNETLSVFGSVLYINGKSDYDDYSAATGATDNPNNTNHTTQQAMRGGFNVDLLDGRLKNTFSAQIYNIDRNLDSVTGFGPLELDYLGSRQKLEYQGAFEATAWLTLQYGADYEKQGSETFDGYDRTDDEATVHGVWTQVGLTPVENLTVNAGVRHDEHSQFGGFTTYRAAGSYLVDQTGTRLHTSYGTGFRAPSLYELYALYGTGNADLKPESSASFDVGVEQRLLGNKLLLDVTYFNLNVDDRIDYVPTSAFTGQYRQVPGKAKSQGVELSARYDVTDWLILGGSYTYTRSSTPDGQQAVRVPEHAFVLSAAVEPYENWSINADLKYVAGTVDIGPTGLGGPVLPIDDYVLLNAKIAYKPNENTEIYVRGENLLNENYQSAKGYAMPGIGSFAGVKLRY